MNRSCVNCGAPATVYHHVVPRSLGGKFTVPLCGDCHGLAHNENRSMCTSVLTKKALAAKRAKGERLGGSIPFGFTLHEDGKTLFPEPKEQLCLNRIEELKAEGFSLRKLTKKLNEEGWEARGKKWHKTTIQRILSRPT